MYSAVLVHMAAVSCVLQDDRHESTWIRDQGLEQKETQQKPCQHSAEGGGAGVGGRGGPGVGGRRAI